MLHSRSVKNLLQYSVLIRVQDQDKFVESVFGDVNIARFARYFKIALYVTLTFC